MRWLHSSLVIVVASTFALQAAAQADPCQASVIDARNLERSGQMLEAQRRLVACQATCAPCATHLREVEKATPSIVIAVRDANGGDVLNAVISVDGQPAIAGHEVQLDPGPHRIAVEHAGSVTTHDILAQTGQRRRVVDITATTVESAVGISPWAIVGFTLAGAGLVVGAVTGGLALSRFDEIETQCNDVGCSEDDISAGSTIAHIATASFVVAGVGAALGIAALLWSSSTEEAAITPILGPGFVGVTTRF